MVCVKIRAALQRLLLLLLLGSTSQSFSVWFSQSPLWTEQYWSISLSPALRYLCASTDPSGTSQLHIQTHSDSVSLDTSRTNLCSQRHEVTMLPELLLHERMPGLKITTSIIYIAPTVFLNSLQYSVNNRNNSAMWVFKFFFTLLLSSSIIKLQDSNQNKNPSSLAVPWKVSRGRAVPLYWDTFHETWPSAPNAPIFQVHFTEHCTFQHILHIPVMCVYTGERRGALKSLVYNFF